jgi:uncharacterized membrane protein
VKVTAAVYSLILVVFGAGLIFLSLASSHHLDKGLVVTNWMIVISFPLTIFYLNKSIYTGKYSKIVLFLSIINCCIFCYCIYDLLGSSDDGFSDAAVSLFLPITGLLLSIFFVIKFVLYAKIKAE